jgi:hypothetical protein
MKLKTATNFRDFTTSHTITINADMGGDSWSIEIANECFVLLNNEQRGDLPRDTDTHVDLSVFNDDGEQLMYAERITWAEAHAFIIGASHMQNVA